MKDILIIGSGGREHTLAWKLSQDEKVQKVHCMPGNGGTREIATNVNGDINDFEDIEQYNEFDCKSLFDILTYLRTNHK